MITSVNNIFDNSYANSLSDIKAIMFSFLSSKVLVTPRKSLIPFRDTLLFAFINLEFEECIAVKFGGVGDDGGITYEFFVCKEKTTNEKVYLIPRSLYTIEKWLQEHNIKEPLKSYTDFVALTKITKEEDLDF